MNRKNTIRALVLAMLLLAGAAIAAFAAGSSHRAALCVIAFWICFALFACVVPITRQQVRKL